VTITMLSEARPSAVASVQALAWELRRLVASLDAQALAALSGREAAAMTAAFASMERLAGAGKTLAAGRVAETGQYRAEGFPSPARWLADVTKASVGDAGRTIATAARLGDEALAPTRQAVVAGHLTPAQTNEIVATAAATPGEQRRLLDLAARETTAALRDECRKVRLAGRPAESPEEGRRRLAQEMRLSTRDRGDGMSDLSARMPTSWLALVLAAVREQADVVFARARQEGREDPHQAYLVEALVTLLLLGPLAPAGGGGGEADVGGEARAGGGEAGGGEDGGGAAADVGADDGACPLDDPEYEALRSMLGGHPPPPRAMRRRRRPPNGLARAKILVRVDQSALVRGWAEGEEICDIAGIGPVPVATVRELWPDAVVKLVLTRGVDVVNVTHLGRRATEAMTAAFQWRPARCSNVTCDNDRFLEIDHRLGYANVHRTRLDELDGLCSQCHRCKTVGNWQLVRGTGRRQFVPPEHPDHPGDPPTPTRRRG